MSNVKEALFQVASAWVLRDTKQYPQERTDWDKRVDLTTPGRFVVTEQSPIDQGLLDAIDAADYAEHA